MTRVNSFANVFCSLLSNALVALEINVITYKYAVDSIIFVVTVETW